MAEAILTTGGGSSTIPIVTEDPENPQDGEMWILVPKENP